MTIPGRRSDPLLLLRLRPHDRDVQPVRAEVVVEQVDPAVFLHAAKELAHFVPPDRGEDVRVLSPKLVILPDALYEAISLGPGQLGAIADIVGGLLLDLEF